MDFEWDEGKRKENLKKHGLDCVDAVTIFEVPMLVHPNTREAYGETRWIGIGFVGTICAVIAFTERDGGKTIRIISVRKALYHERRNFEKAIKDQLG